MDELDFEFYTRPNGHTEFKEYLDSLDVKSKAKLLARINIVAKKELILAFNIIGLKPLDKNLYEIRSRISSNQQRGLYFHVDGTHYVITHGFTKKTQKTPPREIKHAKALRDEYFANRKGAITHE